MTVKEIEEQIYYLNKCKSALTKPMTLDQKHLVENVLRIYIETEKISGVLEYLKERSYIYGEPFSSNEISSIIDNSHNGILSEMAQKILKRSRSC